MISRSKSVGALAIVTTLSACGSCSKNASSGSLVTDAGENHALAALFEAGPTPDEDVLWSTAASGDPDDLARLADREGSADLAREGAADPARRGTAVKALAYGEGYAGLPFLAQIAAGADAAQAADAADSIDALSGRVRTAEDPEDALELRAGCDAITATAKDTTKAKPVRIALVRALRKWADLGCAKPEEIPSDLDVK
ncbi:MAG TPA: hypothetical protein VF407_17325 [Polyangiaceae bacterium]